MKKAGHTNSTDPIAAVPVFRAGKDAWDYWIDAWQRGFLFLDVMQQRSAQREEHAAKLAPHVLNFGCELILDGRKLLRPVNYLLVRITPPKGTEIDERKRPFVIVDPRAGHGPGIGGFKPQSEIGVAFKAGHPCYFIGFLPDPVPGQTIEDIVEAEAVFLGRVIALHPNADGKPAVIGNCQAGWAVMMLAALKPDLFGPIIVAGSPLSYWNGIRGENPMRYTGGLLGGSWLTAMTGDLGNGKFDGAWLVSNFENLNPANTCWSKNYNLYSKIDSEAPRYLEFEKWWGGHIALNAEEMQFIADELFIGNKLAAGDMKTSDGSRIDLRNIKSPIIVFCSKADNITPPTQALGWILDLYDSVDDIRTHGQTIVYAIHDTIGHLGIFVSASVAKKEHDEFASNIDLIDVLPPGLYEAVMTPKSTEETGSRFVSGDYLVRFEARTLEDIRALGGNEEDDDRKFAAAARVSEINLGLYRTFVQPWMRLWSNDGLAQWLRSSHPLRLQYEMFSRSNPFMNAIEPALEYVRKNRVDLPKTNPFWELQEKWSGWIETSLDAYRDTRDRLSEELFHAIYGSDVVQALVGLKASDANARRRMGRNNAHTAQVARRIDELKRRASEGGPREAAVRALIYVRMPDGVIDERGFNLLRHMRESAGSGVTLAEFKKLFREQFLTLLVDERRSVEAIPEMLSRDADLAKSMEAGLRQVIGVVGLHTDEAKARFRQIEGLFQSSHRRTSTNAKERKRPLATVRPMKKVQIVREPKHH